MKRRTITRWALVLLSFSLIVYLVRVKTSTVNRAYGGPVTIQFYGWDLKHNVETNRTVELNYDLKKTLDEATSIFWFSKCPIQDRLVINGEPYFIFDACRDQNGCQLVKRGDQYYLIKEQLIIVRK